MADRTVTTEVWRDFPFNIADEVLSVAFPVSSDHATGKVRSVRAQINWSRFPETVYESPDLRLDARQPLAFDLPDGWALRGWLRWIDDLATYQSQQILGRILLTQDHHNLHWNYEGFMVQFGPVEDTEPNPPSPPDPKEVPDLTPPDSD